MSAEVVLTIPKHIERTAAKRHRIWLRENGHEEEAEKRNIKVWPNYARLWLLKLLGAQEKVVQGRDVTVIHGRRFVTGSFEEGLLGRRPILIRNVADLTRLVKKISEGPGYFVENQIQDGRYVLELTERRLSLGAVCIADLGMRSFSLRTLSCKQSLLLLASQRMSGSGSLWRSITVFLLAF